MAHRYSDRERAVIWALRCQGMQPIDIRRTLASDDDSPLGYALRGEDGGLIAKSSMRDILRKLEQRFGPPRQQIKPGDELTAIDAIRREALGALQARVQELTAKQALGDSLTKAEAGTIDVCVKALDGHERRARALSTSATKQRERSDGQGSTRSAFMDRLSEQMHKPVPNGSGDSRDAAAASGVKVRSAQSSDHDGEDSLARERTDADAQLAGSAT